MSDTAIIVVTYNSAALIGACLDSCLAHEPGAELVVVDNASQDRTPEVVRSRPLVRLIANTENIGFAAAVNQGVRATTAPYILLLNPDARLLTSAQSMAEECRKGAGAVGGKLANPDGSAQTGFALRRFPTAATLAFEALGINRLWPNNPLNRRYRCLDHDLDAPCEAEQPAGAFLMFRRDAWQAVGGFDQAFHPVWFEDVDFCKRLKDRGISIRYTPAAVACHVGGHSVKSLDWADRQGYWYGSLLRYAGKHFRPAQRRLVCVCSGAGLGLRLLMQMVGKGDLAAMIPALRIFRLAGRTFWKRTSCA
jgi:GT2 family glycosyltransferase